MASAAQNEPTEININLMSAPGPSGRLGSAVGWVLTVGRYLIIFTEIIALVIFLLGIKLSADKNDLKDEIKTLGSSVSSQAVFEKEFRSVQQQLNEIKTEKTSQFSSNLVVAEFLKLLPQGMALSSLDIKESDLVFSGSFSSPSQLQTLVASFSESTKITGLDLTELNSPSATNPLFTFNAKASISQANFKETEGTK